MLHNSDLLILSLVFLPLVVSGAGTPPLYGGWVAIEDVHDKDVIEIANFSVIEYDKRTKANLKFQEVLSGETQVVEGINYRLVLRVDDEFTGNKYKAVAVVWEKAWEHFKQLVSFDFILQA